MKSIITIVALAALIASPALAASKKHSRNVNSQEAYAQAQQWQTPRHSTNPAYDVYQNGQYVGSDPDPLLRQLMQREDNANTGD